jgi:selenide, water dikinase
VLRPLTNLFQPGDYPSLLVGLTEPDDAAVYQLSRTQAIVSTVDFFPPVVDDPYDFGAIAAANALSDIYAMGGEPLMAINLVAYPDGYGYEMLSEILRGGAEKVREAGAVIAGGHTVTDKEPKYGLAVTGIVDPEKLLTKGGAKPGDVLILTKPLGSGVITTALKREQAHPDHVNSAVAVMSRLNREASLAAQHVGVHAMTDITGYGLLGHGHEMAHLSMVDFHINFEALSWMPGAFHYGERDIFAGGMNRNRDYFNQWVNFDSNVSEVGKKLLFDPQTSGGLLIAVAASKADSLIQALIGGGDELRIIGEARAGSGRIHIKG